MPRCEARCACSMLCRVTPLALPDSKAQLWQTGSLLLGLDGICVLNLFHAAESICNACLALKAHADIST